MYGNNIILIFTYYLLNHQKMTDVSIKSKKFDFKGNGVKGKIVLTDGTITYFEIDECGDVTQEGNTNQDVTNPIIYGLVEMLMSSE